VSYRAVEMVAAIRGVPRREVNAEESGEANISLSLSFSLSSPFLFLLWY
jgi:hypothetical protein